MLFAEREPLILRPGLDQFARVRLRAAYGTLPKAEPLAPPASLVPLRSLAAHGPQLTPGSPDQRGTLLQRSVTDCSRDPPIHLLG